jgi:ketosteroid isomerase-like protein
MANQSPRDRADALLAAWNQRDYDGVSRQLAPDFVLSDHTRHRLSEGPGGYVDRFRNILEAYPNMRGESKSVLAEGNLVVQETVWQGRQTAPLRISGYDNVAPTNEEMTIHLVTYMELDDEGRIKGMRTYGDLGEVPLAARPAGVG